MTISRRRQIFNMVQTRTFVWLSLLTAALCLSVATVTAASVKVERSGNKEIAVTVDGAPFTTYYFGTETAKPYLMPLRTPGGIIVTRGFPTGNDVSAGDPKESSFEPHQRPLYFAHGNIDGMDFWEEPVFDKYYDDHGHQAYGHMVLEKVEEVKVEDSAAVVRARFLLQDQNNRTIAEETQSYTFSAPSGRRTIDCEFVIQATTGPVTMGDTKEGTFGIRLAPELSGSHAHMVNSSGAEGERAIWGKPADWVNYSGTIDGKPVGIAVFDHPKSFRHPTTWHARAYGLFAANPFGWREFTKDPNKDGSWTIAEGQALTFRYEVVIYDGEFSAERMKEAYQQYAAKH